MATTHDPKRSLITYIAIFLALLVLTAATVFVARIDLGVMNDVVALGIAVTKALLVVLFFMHVRGSSRLTALTATSGFLWLAILLGITLLDYFSRGQVIPVPGK